MARLVVVEQVYHQDGCESASVEPSYSEELTTDEQRFSRRMTVGGAAVPLETGWLTECSLLVLWNRTGRGRPVIPTAKQVETDKAAVVEVRFGGGDPALLSVGESLRVRPAELSGVSLRCRLGEATIEAYVYPK
jgi:hypothetical protein